MRTAAPVGEGFSEKRSRMEQSYARGQLVCKQASVTAQVVTHDDDCKNLTLPPLATQDLQFLHDTMTTFGCSVVLVNPFGIPPITPYHWPTY